MDSNFLWEVALLWNFLKWQLKKKTTFLGQNQTFLELIFLDLTESSTTTCCNSKMWKRPKISPPYCFSVLTESSWYKSKFRRISSPGEWMNMDTPTWWYTFIEDTYCIMYTILIQALIYTVLTHTLMHIYLQKIHTLYWYTLWYTFTYRSYPVLIHALIHIYLQKIHCTDICFDTHLPTEDTLYWNTLWCTFTYRGNYLPDLISRSHICFCKSTHPILKPTSE